MVEYREARFTRNQTADAVADASVMVRAAAEWIGANYDESESASTGQIDQLVRELEREARREGIDLGHPPWSTTVALLTALSEAGATFGSIFSGE